LRDVNRTLARARAALGRYTLEVWGRDRAAMRGWRRPWNRALRVVIWTARGALRDRLSLQAAALTYYTVFSIVPVLVVVLWVLKLLDFLPTIAASEPATAAGNVPLRQAAHAIVLAAQRERTFALGLTGLLALGYGVLRLVVHVGQALTTISATGERAPAYWRTVGYLVLLIFPPVVLAVFGVADVVLHSALGAPVREAAARLLGALPVVKVALGAVAALAIISLGLTILYASSARARIAFPSAFVGGVVGALLLPAVLWVFVEFQIGVARAGRVPSGMAAIPVFLLWAFASWYAILIGAEVAVGHGLDRVLVHGARAFALDAAGMETAGREVMAALARCAAPGHPAASADDLARELRLPPRLIRDVATRLVEAGSVRRDEAGRYALADPAAADRRDCVSG
jgi:membrane protein